MHARVRARKGRDLPMRDSLLLVFTISWAGEIAASVISLAWTLGLKAP